MEPGVNYRVYKSPPLRNFKIISSKSNVDIVCTYVIILCQNMMSNMLTVTSNKNVLTGVAFDRLTIRARVKHTNPSTKLHFVVCL